MDLWHHMNQVISCHIKPKDYKNLKKIFIQI